MKNYLILIMILFTVVLINNYENMSQVDSAKDTTPDFSMTDDDEIKEEKKGKKEIKPKINDFNLFKKELNPNGFLKSLKLRKSRDINNRSINLILGGIVVYDNNNKVINDWFNPRLKDLLDATIKSDPNLFIKKEDNAKPSTLLYDELGVKFDYLENYFKAKNNGFKGDNAKPLNILKSNLDEDKYGYPKIPIDSSPMRYHGIYSFKGDLIIDFKEGMHVDNISKIRIIHAIKNNGDKENYVFSGIFLDKNAWKLSRFNLELINTQDKTILSEPVGSKIFAVPDSHTDSKIKNQRKERLMTEIKIELDESESKE